jgi:hypothetical protein
MEAVVVFSEILSRPCWWSSRGLLWDTVPPVLMEAFVVPQFVWRKTTKIPTPASHSPRSEFQPKTSQIRSTSHSTVSFCSYFWIRISLLCCLMTANTYLESCYESCNQTVYTGCIPNSYSRFPVLKSLAWDRPACWVLSCFHMPYGQVLGENLNIMSRPHSCTSFPIHPAIRYLPELLIETLNERQVDSTKGVCPVAVIPQVQIR